MDFQNAIKSAFQRWNDFSSRSSRSEYWFFFLFSFLGGLAATFLDSTVTAGLAYILFILVTIVPNIALSVRRLHDVDKSGWWLLLGFIPVIGFIILLIWFCSKGTEGPNRFGTNPLSVI